MRRLLLVLIAVTAVIVALPLLEYSLRAARIVWQEPADWVVVPVEGVSRRAVRDSWHAPRSGGRRHEGIDIFAPRHTPVRSATPGIVWRIGRNRLGGNVVWVMGPGGRMHYYAHLEAFADIHMGQIVAAGEQLGTVGDSGNARGAPPHLHYGIYAAGGAANPFPLLSGPTS